MMKKLLLLAVEEERLVFEGGHTLSFCHDQDCCEYNYADFTVFEGYLGNYFVYENYVKIKFVEGFGFVLYGFYEECVGSPRDEFPWPIFVPCYSEQNGYYTTDIEIYWDDEKIASGSCMERFY